MERVEGAIQEHAKTIQQTEEEMAKNQCWSWLGRKIDEKEEDDGR